jgi:hypothetical protein
MPKRARKLVLVSATPSPFDPLRSSIPVDPTVAARDPDWQAKVAQAERELRQAQSQIEVQSRYPTRWRR